MEAEFEEYKRYFFLLEVSVELNEVLVWLMLSVVCVCQSVCSQLVSGGSSCDHYRWCIRPHCTDIWWLTIEARTEAHVCICIGGGVRCVCEHVT